MHCVYFPPEVGGLESHVFYLCRALAEMGHQVDVVTSRSIPGTPVHEVMDGVRVHRTWFPGKSPAGWTAHALGSIPETVRRARGRGAVAAASGPGAPRAGAAGSGALGSGAVPPGPVDIVHAQAFASVLPALRAARAADAPLVTTWHTSHFLMRAERGIWPPVFRWMLRTSDYNLAASSEIAEVGERLAPGVRVEALTNGVDTRRFAPVPPALEPPSEGHRIIVPRRLHPKNGVEFAVRALPLILRETPVEMVVVGDGPERGRLEGLARELGVWDRIRFMGAQPNDRMPGLLSSADVALIPSLMEATSVAALECMSCQLPVAASDVGGLPEIVDASVGTLFPPADPEGLARAVVELLRDPHLPERGRIGRERVVHSWSNDRLARRHLEIYRHLLS
jgi:glycosyltransferase involved in cell wall biosynthesis